MSGRLRWALSVLVLLCGGSLLWLGWRVNSLALQVAELQTQVDELTGDLDAEDEAVAQAQTALGDVRQAADTLFSLTQQADPRDGGAALQPAWAQALQDLDEALGQAESALGGTDDTPADPPAQAEPLSA